VERSGIHDEEAAMSGLDDILGNLTKSGGTSSGGLDDLLGGLLGGSGGGGAGGLQDVLGGLLGGGSAGGGIGTKAGGMNMGALAAALAPLVLKLLKGGGLQKLMQNAQANGLTSEADSWVGTGENQQVSADQMKSVVGHAAVQQVAQQAGISEDEAAGVLAHVVPQVVNGLTPNGQLPSNDDLDQLAAKFGG
jgi:uncharacterized protein YidB (DUF937 family)